MHRDKSIGIATAIAAYTLWGFLPVYWKVLGEVPALEVLSHRIIWSLVFVTLIIAWGRQWDKIRPIIAEPHQMRLIILAAVMIALNWGLFIWAVQSNHLLDSSLGYYINPLIAVLLGVVVFKEKLNPWQKLAIASATIGVLILVIKAGRFPWLSFALALTFGTYGAVKKAVKASPLVGLALETAVLAPLALVFILTRQASGQGALGASNLLVTLFLLGAGVATAIPLILFAFSAKRIPLSTLGITQYIAPTLMFLFGVFVYHEPFQLVNGISFGFIWLAVVIYSLSQTRVLSRKEANQVL
ncbi:MAG: EamA family transporter RarD [Eubacteriales bacterium]|nr:EamA family transporter RarD [Eubacteriales bacterium]